ncbi:hypothetical protein B0H14DRAFT_2646279 [Mycena olivaceomarginata]|nr:hypothetical protein B0H14DRAFT_2646279 [Mycena olivaceomarginata]
MFPQAAELSPSEIKAYRKWVTSVFSDALGDPNKDPFFSVEDAPSRVTSSGYQLHALHDESVISSSFWAPEDALSKDLNAFRNLTILGLQGIPIPNTTVHYLSSLLKSRIYPRFLFLTVFLLSLLFPRPLDANQNVFNPNFFDEFLANLNSGPHTTMPTNFGYDDNSDLEHFGPPTNYNMDSVLAQLEFGQENETVLVCHLEWFMGVARATTSARSTLSTVSLPVNAIDLEPNNVAARDLNLELDERNILTVKRRRTKSSRAADSVTGPTKRGPLSR